MPARLLLIAIILLVGVSTVVAETQILSNCPQENVFARSANPRIADDKAALPTEDRCCLLCIAAVPTIAAFGRRSLRPVVSARSFLPLVAIDQEPLKRPPKHTS
jgi:hypothetical protein